MPRLPRAIPSAARGARRHPGLDAILECVTQPVWVLDHDGYVRSANAAAVAALGYEDASQLVGLLGHETVHHTRPDGSRYPAEECPMAIPRLTGSPVRGEDEWFVRRDGSMFPVSFAAAPLDMAGGRGAVVVFTDLEQRRAEQERIAILDRLAQPVWVVDHDGCFRYANPAAVAALGYDDASELVGRPGHDTVHYKYPDGRPFPESECPVAHARVTGSTVTDREDWLVRRDGSIMPITYSTAPFELDGGHGSVTAFADVEEQRRAEHATRERDVARARAEELAAARRRIIEAADAARAQLARDLHDGAQQQFVSALLHLQTAEESEDPARAAELRARATELARAGLSELRDLAAGMHPAILSERGLGPAVEALASGLPLPVDVAVAVERRLPGPVEASVYFFVSEALANVVKHAGAARAAVRIQAGEETLVVEVRDDGVGGAEVSASGVGLRGLADRIAALDGTLTVTSPRGEGTTLLAGVPLQPS